MKAYVATLIEHAAGFISTAAQEVDDWEDYGAVVQYAAMLIRNICRHQRCATDSPEEREAWVQLNLTREALLDALKPST